MKLRDFISTDKEYDSAAYAIRAWVEEHYPGLSMEFNWPSPEIIQVDPTVRFTKRRVRKITEIVNIKIGEILEQFAERIYIAERLDRIYANHPEFDLEVTCIEDIKHNIKFQHYLDELVIRE